MKVRSLIIDDNSFIINLLSDQLRQNHPEIELLGYAKSGTEGLNKIRTLKPDLIFLDVEMDDMTGFDMLTRLDDISFQTIFITSHSHYAIKAIRFNALDYLLKPINERDLARAIKRHSSKSILPENKNHVHKALINLQTKKVEDQTLFLYTQQGLLRLALKRITKIESDRNYSYIHLSNNTKVLSSKTLGYFEDILTEKGFLRCHRSFLVNHFHIKTIRNQDSFLLQDNSTVPISRRRKSEVKSWFLSLR
ncbi:MAG: response regulator [Bacteroidota bacterium]